MSGFTGDAQNAGGSAPEGYEDVVDGEYKEV
jgi:hypothetical protein